METLENLQNMEKTGYLDQEFRLFHIRDQVEREFVYHYHDFYKVVIFLSGKAAYHIEGKTYSLKPWDILLVDKYAIHRPEIDSSVDRFILWIRSDIQEDSLTRCFQKASDRSFNLVRLKPQLQEKLKEILYDLDEALHQEAFGQEILTKALFEQFLVYLNRIFLEKAYICDPASYTCDAQIDSLLQYINQNLEQDLSIEKLAQKYFVSKYYMMRKFKAQTGLTIHSYITSKRLLLARSLIQEGMPVTKAALQCGFGDYTSFVRAYKKEFKTTPGRK
jgi:AraC-like DNA-binding protein